MDHTSFVTGVRDVAPAQLANVSIGILFGASAVQVGLTPAASTAFSLLAVAARAQLIAVELLQNDATVPVVVATILLINVRYITFSAALVPKVDHLSWRWRALIAYPLIDITYAVADTRFSEADGDSERDTDADADTGAGDSANTDADADTGTDVEGSGAVDDSLHRGWYFLGVGASWVLVFTAATLAGTLLGRAVGDQYHLEFMVPLLFIALLASQIQTRQGLLAAVAAGGLAIVGTGLPFNLGLLVAALVGAAVGTYLDAKKQGAGQ